MPLIRKLMRSGWKKRNGVFGLNKGRTSKIDSGGRDLFQKTKFGSEHLRSYGRNPIPDGPVSYVVRMKSLSTYCCIIILLCLGEAAFAQPSIPSAAGEKLSGPIKSLDHSVISYWMID